MKLLKDTYQKRILRKSAFLKKLEKMQAKAKQSKSNIFPLSYVGINVKVK